MSTSVVNSVSGFGATVSGMWRSHSTLSESEPESSPEAAQRFRKLRSSSSLNSLRMSLRKRLPLKTVQPTDSAEPSGHVFHNSKKTSAVTQMKRTAKNTIGNAYQKFQKSTLSREECLVRTPGKILEGEENEGAPVSAPARTPKRQAATPRRTPRSGAKRTPRAAATPEPGDSAVRAVKTGGTRRQLVRMAALRSPFASPNTASRRRLLDQDLDRVSKGLKKLKRLSRAFDEVIGRDERSEAIEHCRTVMAQRRDSASIPSGTTGKLNTSFIQQQSRQIRHRVGSWTDSALSNLRKTT